MEKLEKSTMHRISTPSVFDNNLLSQPKIILQEKQMMIILNRILKLRDLEISMYVRMKASYLMQSLKIREVRLQKKIKKLNPLCYMDDEDISEILNVFRIYLIHDEKLNKEDSILLRSFFSDFVNNTNLTNFIINEYIQKDVYENEHKIESFNKILKKVGSNYVIENFDEKKWMYLSQD